MKKLNKNLVRTALAVYFVFAFCGAATAFAAGPVAVNLGTAANFAILAKTGISTTGNSAIVGDLGLSPAAASYVTGFGLMLPASSTFSTSALVTGKIYAPGYADPTSATLTTAVLDMQNAYTDGAGRAPSVTELGAGNIGGLTLVPGIYKWSSGVTIPTDVTLSGGANDVWIFQIAQNLFVSSGGKVVLSGGAQASNIFWVVGGQTTLGTTSVLNGNILDQTAIVMNTGAQLNGRALAQTAVTLDTNNVAMPASATPVPAPTPAPTPVYILISTSTPVPTPTPTSLVVNVALQAQLTDLLATVQSLQAQVQAKQQESATAAAPASTLGQQIRTIAIDLGQGSKDNSVAILQNFLIAQNKGLAAQALANVGATAYFGTLTRAALAEFQANVAISPALGNFGPVTRAYLSAHYQ